jgi:Zn-dependent protease
MERLLTTFFNPPIDQPSHRLGAIAGIEIRAVPGWWLTLLGMLAAGQVVGWIIGPGEGVERILAGLGYGLIFVGSQVVHAAGHMVSGKLIDAPMDALLVTMTRWVNVYDDTGKRIPRRVHLGRALGGPIANLLVGTVFLLFALTNGGSLLWAGAVVNLLAGLGALLPFPSVDGAVIWLKRT